MAEFSRQQFPSGGYQFRQPQTGWVNPLAMVGFKASVDAIIKHRKSNPAITAKHQLSTDPVAVADELENFNRARLGIPAVAPNFLQRSSQITLPARVVAAVHDIKRAAQGTGVVLDWLTSGGQPVGQELANARAAVCASCPKNVPGDWYTTAPAELIKSTLEARGDLKLETPLDAELKSCEICRCLMRLKVWCPMDHIVARTKPDIMSEFPEFCWIAKRE